MIDFEKVKLGDRVKGIDHYHPNELGTIVAKLGKEHYKGTNTRLVILFDNRNTINSGMIEYKNYDVLETYIQMSEEERRNRIGYVYKNEEKTLELISSGRFVKLKTFPVVKHVIVRNSCGNFEGFVNNYNEAVNKLNKVTEAYTIYRMIPVAEVSPSVKIKKIRVKRI